MSATSPVWSIETVLFVDDSSDEIFLADFTFKKEAINSALVHFVDFQALLNHLSQATDHELERALVVLDLNLTISKGSDGIAELRRHDRYRDMILGICSGSDDPADRLSSLQSGADFFVSKPLNRGALLAICKQVPHLSEHDEGDGRVSFVRTGT